MVVHTPEVRQANIYAEHGVEQTFDRQSRKQARLERRLQRKLDRAQIEGEGKGLADFAFFCSLMSVVLLVIGTIFLFLIPLGTSFILMMIGAGLFPIGLILNIVAASWIEKGKMDESFSRRTRTAFFLTIVPIILLLLIFWLAAGG